MDLVAERCDVALQPHPEHRREVDEIAAQDAQLMSLSEILADFLHDLGRLIARRNLDLMLSTKARNTTLSPSSRACR
ncbi:MULTISPECIES: hypothetical protein [unclassified Streptomyces]|uniref:hypothetical protein n=1 Tax=unclassified Streptomyces TaxID=2593676 RepID=UPI002E35A036|nr:MULTISPECIES: hypothetical protein [unclassified Streptomyces]WUC68487.1 hypothetical protein OG861_32020 [Streptomyces sp. NBC_00539]